MSYKNQYDEVSPDEAEIQIYASSDGKIHSVHAQNSVVDRKWQDVSVLERAAQIYGDHSYPASPRVEGRIRMADFHIEQGGVTIADRPHSFTYMDVGRWGGERISDGHRISHLQKNFGIVWGTYAALCEYVAKDSALDAESCLLCATDGKPHDIPINALIRQLRTPNHSVRVLKWLQPRQGKSVDWQTVYIILPDLHLPVVVKKPPDLPDASQPKRPYAMTSPNELTWRTMPALVSGDGKAWARLKYTDVSYCDAGTVPVSLTPDGDGIVTYPNGARALGNPADLWFDRYIAGDIFGGPNDPASKDLEAFLDRVVAANLPGFTKHFVQIGDMYDLWIGLDRYYAEVKDDQIGAGGRKHDVILTNTNGVVAGAFIDEWVKRTEDCFPALVRDRLNQLHLKPGLSTSWLWGNHDNYFAAHTALKPDGSGRIVTRQRDIRTSGVFIEHGQRGDPSNRDGAPSGHAITQDVFRHPFLRKADPVRRNYFLAAAALAYVIQPDFCIYTMGHTHMPYATQVKVWVTKLDVK
jgi:hypothetical protein